MGTLNRQRVIELALKIQATRDRLAELEAELDTLTIPDSASATLSGPRKPEKTPTTRPDDGKSLPERILGIMRKDPSRAFTASDFEELEQAGITKMPTIRTSLVRLFNNGAIAKLERGAYQLKSDPKDIGPT
jgi:hypothetical protein